jgi:hypothetical protein
MNVYGPTSSMHLVRFLSTETLTWAQHWTLNMLPIFLNGPRITHESYCRLSRMGPELFIRDTADGLEWPQRLLIHAADGLKWAQSSP